MISQSDKQKEILAAALALFAAYGFHGTPTSKIAKEAGVANGTLFHYYKTKEDLIVSLYIDIKTRMGEYVEQNAPAAGTIKEDFKNMYTQVLLWSLQNRAEFQFLQQFQASPYASQLSTEDIQRLISKSCAQIELAIKEKAIKHRDINFILTLMSSHTFGVHQYLIKAGLHKLQDADVIKDSFEMLWNMMA